MLEAFCHKVTKTRRFTKDLLVRLRDLVPLWQDFLDALLKAYGIRSIPTLILFNEGKEVERLIGAASKESISRMIDKHSKPIEISA